MLESNRFANGIRMLLAIAGAIMGVVQILDVATTSDFQMTLPLGIELGIVALTALRILLSRRGMAAQLVSTQTAILVSIGQSLWLLVPVQVWALIVAFG